MKPEKSTGLTGSTLKWIALITMFIDHIGAVLLENGLLPLLNDSVLVGSSLAFRPDSFRTWYMADYVLRMIGRLAFPIYCFLLVEGFYYTKNVLKYIFRLGAFALISEIPFNLAHGSLRYDAMQNVYFTLAIGLLTLWCMQLIDTRLSKYVWLKIPAALLGMLLAEFLRTDYSSFGVLLIILLYLLRENRLRQSIAGAIATVWETTAPLAFVLTYFYNGKRGRQLPKYFFYVFYPAHLLLLAGIRAVLF